MCYCLLGEQGESPCFQDLSFTIQVITTALGYPPELESKTLLLKTPHTWATRNREINLVLICQRCCVGCWGKVLPSSELSDIMTCLARRAHWCKGGTNVIVPTNHFLIEFTACSTRWNPWLVGTIHSTQKSQLARSWALGENVMLFNSAKWTECQTAFQILTVIARISAAFNVHQRSLRLTEVNTETHNSSKCRDSDCGKLSSKWDIYITPCSPQTSVRERGKHCRSQRSGRTTGNHFFQTWQGCCSHELRAAVVPCLHKNSTRLN